MEVDRVPPGQRQDIFFLNEKTGWVAGPDGRLAATSDGGHHWTDIIARGAHEYWRGVWFLDDRRGFVVGGLASPHEDFIPPKILATEDGGRTWTDVTPLQYRGKKHAAFDRIQFCSPTQGFIYGQQLLATQDAGKTWVEVGKDEYVSGYRCMFSSPTVGWFIHNDDLLKSTDGGRTWRPTGASAILSEDERIHGGLSHTYFRNEQCGWLITNWGRILSTEDGGRRWTDLGKSAQGSVQEALLLDSTHAWAIALRGGECYVVRTTDGGRTWQEPYHTSRRLVGMFAIHKDLCWVVGEDTVVRITGAR